MRTIKKLVLIGVPTFYLIGAGWIGSMYLSYGAPTTLDAILFGAQWPLYIGHFLS